MKSIVTFVKDDEVHYQKFGFEKVLRIPLHGEQVPPEEQTKQLLEFIQDSNDWPVHVHCAAEKDGTGMMIPLARYAIDGWPIDEALAEARRYRGG